jgi:O-antigen ligase
MWKKLKQLLAGGFVLLLASLAFFSECQFASAPGWLRTVITEFRAACRDPGTQWMVFACCAIYFVTFTILSQRGTRSAERGTTCTLQHSTFNLLGNADLWLCGLLLISALHYAFNYDTASGSTQALMLMAGAAIGKGAHLWVSWGVLTTKLASQARFQMDSQGDKAASRHEVTNNTKGGTDNLQPATFNLQLLLATLLLLLAAASLWHPETAMQFQYRGLNRWSGPWDNPNIFGLLMGTGVVIGAGLLVSRWRLKFAGSPGEERTHCQNQRKASPSPRLAGLEGPNGERAGVRCAFHHLGIWLWRVTLFAALACCAVGLLKSYSRGAWLGTMLGLGVLLVQFIVLRPRSRPSSSNDSPLSRDSCLSRLIKNRLPLAILVVSLLVICFWEFRYTEFHPVRRAFSVGNQADFSWRNRVAAWEGSLAMMADRPLTGFGWNKPERIYDQYYRQPKVSEGMAIQLNHYFILGMSLGLPALLCFVAYLGLSLTRNTGESNRKSQIVNLKWVCHGGAVVLLVGLWFDGGLFNLATASLFWVLLEVGRATPCAPECELSMSVPGGLTRPAASPQPSTTNPQPWDK